LPSAIILVNTSIGMEKNVLKSLKSNIGVEVFPVQGAYDIVVKVKADTFDNLKASIARINRSLPKIRHMVTTLIVGVDF
jgi:hypothetical protein